MSHTLAIFLAGACCGIAGLISLVLAWACIAADAEAGETERQIALGGAAGEGGRASHPRGNSR